MYGKLENGILIPAPKTITKDGWVHYHPSDELYAEFGYLEVVETQYPETSGEDNKYYVSSYEIQDNKIVKVWTETELPEPEPVTPTTEERITTLEEQLKAAKIILGVE